MILEIFEKIEVIFKTKRQVSFWSKVLNVNIEINIPISIHWELLKTSTFRRNKMTIKCDCCDLLYENSICNIDANKIHHCIKCRNKGDRNGMYGTTISEALLNGRNKLFKERGNPFTWESSKQKNKEINVWAKIALKTKGLKRSEETKLRLSNSIKLAYEEGRLKPNKQWGNIIIKEYKDIEYQSTYELNFIKHCEFLGIFNLLERGPKIKYLDLEGKSHTYYSDYMIKNTDIVIEIKSNFTWDKNIEINIQKKLYSEKIYDYILIMDNDFTNFNEKIKFKLNI